MFRYFQVRDYVNKEIKQTNRDSNVISIFTDAYKAKESKHLISHTYKKLQNPKNHSTLQVKQKWERETGEPFGRVKPKPPTPEPGVNSARRT